MKNFIKKILLTFIIVLLLGFARSGYAVSTTDIYVDTFVDEDTINEQCSLREAIHSANGNPRIDCVTSDPGSGANIFLQDGHYHLGIPGRGDDLNHTGDLDIRRSMNIHGMSKNSTFIDGEDIDRVFELAVSGISVLIADVTIRNGYVDSPGEGGGGILMGDYQGATLTLNNCIVKDNDAREALGGGIDNYQGTVLISNCSIENNIAYNGGGIYNDGNLEINNSLIHANIALNQGGGIKNAEPGGQTLMTNVTIGKNSGDVGSGIYSNMPITMINVTVVGNQGSAAGFVNLNTASLKNTIFAWHTSTLYPDQKNCTGDADAFTSLGNNLEDNPEDFNSCQLTGIGDLVDIDPLFVGNAPVDNGGPTYTFALQDNSPAIDAGTNDGCPSTDQRGFQRPLDGDGDGNATCDIGAYEAPMKIYMPVIFR